MTSDCTFGQFNCKGSLSQHSGKYVANSLQENPLVYVMKSELSLLTKNVIWEKIVHSSSQQVFIYHRFSSWVSVSHSGKDTVMVLPLCGLR